MNISNLLTLIRGFIMENLAYIEYGNHIDRVKASLRLALLFSPSVYFTDLIHRYVLTDRSFAEILIILIIFDLLSGMAKHWKLHTFSFFELFKGLLIKVFASITGLIVFNAFGQIKGMDQNTLILANFILFGKLCNAVYVGGSFFNNLYILTGRKFPPLAWMNRMKDFNKSGSISNLTGEDKTIPSEENKA